MGDSVIYLYRCYHIPRNRWLNYEKLRSPLRCDVALRICRELIVSEEWLATGNFAAVEAEAARRKIGWGPVLNFFYLRQCMDLQAEPEFLEIRPGVLFSAGYRDKLGAKYANLIAKYFYYPRIVFRDSDSDALLLRYMEVVNARILKMLQNEAVCRSRGEGTVRRTYIKTQFLVGNAAFKRMMDLPTPEVAGPEYDFLRAIVNYEDMPIGPIHVRQPDDENEPRSIRGRK